MISHINPIVRHSSFGDWYDIGTTDADVVILATNDGHGLVPRLLCLPHQVYVAKVSKLEKRYGSVTVIPARSHEYVKLPTADVQVGRYIE